MKRARDIYREAYSYQEELHDRDKHGRVVRTWRQRFYRHDAPGLRAWARRKFADTAHALSPKLLEIVAGG